jgi:hypothetical protein
MDALNTSSLSSTRKQRSHDDFLLAVGNLQKSIAGDPVARRHIGDIAFPNISNNSNDFAIESMALDLDAAVTAFIQERMMTRRRARDLRTQKIKCILSKWMRASYPFVNIVLTIAKEGASVSSRECAR